MSDRPPASVLPPAVDVVVIGGGIVGVSTAYYLAKSGVRVALCEKGGIACEQSSRNWGFIRKQGRHPSEIPLMILALELWHELVADLETDIGFRVGGTLYLSETEQRYHANLAWLEHAGTFGLDSTFLSVSELKALVPGMQNQVRGALFTPSDASAEPAFATLAIAEKARAGGALLLSRCAVRGIDLEGGKVSGVVTEHGRIRCQTAVCAGGAWSGYFCRHLGLVFPHLKVISSVMATVPTDILVGGQNIWSSGLGMRRRRDGGYTVAYGGSSRCEITPDLFRFFRTYLPAYRHSKEVVTLKLGTRFFRELVWPAKWSFDKPTPFEKERVLDPDPDLAILDKAHGLLGRTFPDLQGIDIAQRWAGMIDVTPDELPVISTVRQIPGLVISTGYSGHGFGIGPGAGKVTADLAVGKTPDTDLSAFALERLL
ncbi:MAG: FAD-binding oxidoreductase [Gammaproteobacteria bacterium]|nr:FAD-binding oxidoreductase [Gammaproteobacteria bacterium]